MNVQGGFNISKAERQRKEECTYVCVLELSSRNV